MSKYKLFVSELFPIFREPSYKKISSLKDLVNILNYFISFKNFFNNLNSYVFLFNKDVYGDKSEKQKYSAIILATVYKNLEKIVTNNSFIKDNIEKFEEIIDEENKQHIIFPQSFIKKIFEKDKKRKKNICDFKTLCMDEIGFLNEFVNFSLRDMKSLEKILSNRISPSEIIKSIHIKKELGDQFEKQILAIDDYCTKNKSNYSLGEYLEQASKKVYSVYQPKLKGLSSDVSKIENLLKTLK